MGSPSSVQVENRWIQHCRTPQKQGRIPREKKGIIKGPDGNPADLGLKHKNFSYLESTNILDNTYRAPTSNFSQIILNHVTVWHFFNFHNLIIVGAQFFSKVLL